MATNYFVRIPKTDLKLKKVSGEYFAFFFYLFTIQIGFLFKILQLEFLSIIPARLEILYHRQTKRFYKLN